MEIKPLSEVRGEYCNYFKTLEFNEDDYITISLLTDANLEKYSVRYECPNYASRLLNTESAEEAIEFYRDTITEYETKNSHLLDHLSNQE